MSSHGGFVRSGADIVTDQANLGSLPSTERVWSFDRSSLSLQFDQLRSVKSNFKGWTFLPFDEANLMNSLHPIIMLNILLRVVPIALESVFLSGGLIHFFCSLIIISQWDDVSAIHPNSMRKFSEFIYSLQLIWLASFSIEVAYIKKISIKYSSIKIN